MTEEDLKPGLYWIRRLPVKRPDGTMTEPGRVFAAEYTFVTDSNGNFTKHPIWWKMGGGLDDIDQYEVLAPVLTMEQADCMDKHISALIAQVDLMELNMGM